MLFDDDGGGNDDSSDCNLANFTKQAKVEKLQV